MTFTPPNPSGRYFVRLLIGTDEFVNVLTGGNLDETVSSRAGRAAYTGKLWGKILSWWLGKISKNHCRRAELHDEQRAAYVAWLESQADPADAMKKAGFKRQ